MYRNINILKAGGVELRGMKASLAPRRQQSQAAPKLEQYTFIPYDNTTQLKVGRFFYVLLTMHPCIIF